MPKTASSSLQANLFAGHSELTYLGIMSSFTHETPLGIHLTPPGELLRRVHEEQLDDQEVARIRPNLDQRLAPYRQDGKTPVYSYEILSCAGDCRRPQAEQFARLLGPCKIILFVRHPHGFAESLYLQHYKTVNWYPPAPVRRFPKEFRDRIRQYRRWLDETYGKPPLHFDIETWFQRMWHPPEEPETDLRCLQYADTANTYAEVFGRDAVRVVLFEQLVEDPPGIVASLCQFLGIDPGEGVRLMDQRRENERWTMEQVERVHQIKHSWRESLRFRFASRARRAKMLRFGEHSVRNDAPTARAEIPDAWKQQLDDYTRQQNRRLLEQWNLPVDRYGYPL